MSEEKAKMKAKAEIYIRVVKIRGAGIPHVFLEVEVFLPSVLKINNKFRFIKMIIRAILTNQ